MAEDEPHDPHGGDLRTRLDSAEREILRLRNNLHDLRGHDLQPYFSRVAQLQNQVERLEDRVSIMTDRVVTKDQLSACEQNLTALFNARFDPVTKLVYGAVAVILIAVLSAVIGMVVIANRMP